WSRRVPGGGKEIRARYPNRTAMGKYRRLHGRAKMGEGRPGGEGHASEFVDESQYAAWERSMGASCPVRLHRAERELERVPERAARQAVRSVSPDQLALVLGVCGWER